MRARLLGACLFLFALAVASRRQQIRHYPTSCKRRSGSSRWTRARS